MLQEIYGQNIWKDDERLVFDVLGLMLVDLKANCQLQESRKWSMTPGPHIFFRSGKVERVERGFAGSTFSFFGFGSGQSDAWISLNGLS